MASILAKAMTCCLTTPSHCLNQCWLEIIAISSSVMSLQIPKVDGKGNNDCFAKKIHSRSRNWFGLVMNKQLRFFLGMLLTAHFYQMQCIVLQTFCDSGNCQAGKTLEFFRMEKYRKMDCACNTASVQTIDPFPLKAKHIVLYYFF